MNGPACHIIDGLRCCLRIHSKAAGLGGHHLHLCLHDVVVRSGLVD